MSLPSVSSRPKKQRFLKTMLSYSNMSNTPIQTIEVSIDSLIPSEYNPRLHDEESASQLKRSIQEFGFCDPLIVNSYPPRNNHVIGGHFRLQIAKELGYTTVPVVYISIEDLEKEKELNLRLNRNVGSWDWKLLAEYSIYDHGTQ